MRQRLDDDRWFDTSKAKKFTEETEWDGRNHVSLATGSQFDHETLYRTAGGRWILNHWSQWQGSRPSWREIDDEEAARWLVRNTYSSHEACAEEYAALEVK